MRKFIFIRWSDGSEVVDAKLGQNPIDNEIQEVETYFLADSMVCNTTSQRHIESDKSQKITINYSMEENTALVGDPDNLEVFGPPEDWYWGTSTITIAADLNSAKAVWNDNNPEYNDEAQCTVLSQELFEQMGLEFVFRKKREADFRRLLLSLDKNCAITFEKTQAVLEAAHIIGKSENGAESIRNGILLRADIHRLYDRRFFEIRPDGSIEISEDKSSALSEKYRNILNSAKVSEKIISRVMEALAKRSG